MDKATKKVNPITRDFNPAVDFLQWNRVDGCIYFNTTDEDCRHIYRYVPKTESFEMLPLQEDVISSWRSTILRLPPMSVVAMPVWELPIRMM